MKSIEKWWLYNGRMGYCSIVHISYLEFTEEVLKRYKKDTFKYFVHPNKTTEAKKNNNTINCKKFFSNKK